MCYRENQNQNDVRFRLRTKSQIEYMPCFVDIITGGEKDRRMHPDKDNKSTVDDQKRKTIGVSGGRVHKI